MWAPDSLDYNADMADEDYGKLSGTLKVYMDSGLNAQMAQVSRAIQISCKPTSFFVNAPIDINDETVIDETLQKMMSVDVDKKSMKFYDMENGEFIGLH